MTYNNNISRSSQIIIPIPQNAVAVVVVVQTTQPYPLAIPFNPATFPAPRAMPPVQYPTSCSSYVGGQMLSRTPNQADPLEITVAGKSVGLGPIKSTSQQNPTTSDFSDAQIKSIIQYLWETDSNRVICDQKPKSKAPFSTAQIQDPRRTRQREKQIHFGLISRGYINLSFISRESESPLPPPSVTLECTKVEFECKIAVWKKELHKYDNKTLPLSEMKKHPNYERIKQETERRLELVNRMTGPSTHLPTNFENYIEYLEYNEERTSSPF